MTDCSRSTVTPGIEPAGAPRWWLLAGVWVIYLVFGLVTASLAPLVGLVATDMAIGPAQMGFVLAAWPLIYIIASLPAGAVLDRLGAGPAMLLASGLMALSAMLRGLAEGPVSLGLAVAILGMGGPLISVGAPKLVAGLFHGKARGMAMGIYITGPYVGGLIALGLTNSLFMPLADNSWRGVMAIHAFLALGSGLLWLVIALIPGPARQLRSLPLIAGPVNGGVIRLLHAPEVRTILLMAILIFALNHALNNWLPALLEGAGLTPVEAGYWASIPSLAGIAGALVIPRLAAGGRHVAVLAGLGCAMLLATLLLHMPPGAALLSGLLLQGLARGAMMTVALLLLMDSQAVPVDRIGLAGGLFFSVAQIGGSLGPAVFGVALQFGDGFGLPLVALTLMSALLLLALVWLQGLQGRQYRS